MALVTSYSTLISAVQGYLARGDLAPDVPGFIQNFEQRFCRQPRNYGPWMEAELNETIAAGVIQVPADYLLLKHFYVQENPSARLEYVSLEQCFGRYPRNGWAGFPCWMSRERGNFVFGPEPDQDYTIKGTYYAKPVSLRQSPNDAVDHWLINNAVDLCVYGALLEAEPYIKNDSRIAVWSSFFERALHDYRDFIRAEDHTFPGQEVLA